jgi:hypothetical protein
MKNTTRPGFMMIMTFMMLTIGVVVATQLFFKGSVYTVYMSSVKKREQAKRLARSGIQIALNQLALQDTKIIEEEEDEKKSKDPIVRQKKLLKTLLTVQNKWQTFSLQEPQDGIEGIIKICITCEDGKIPLNALIDYKKQEFIKTTKEPVLDGKEVMQKICEKIKEIMVDTDLFEGFLEFIKESKTTPADITSLFTQKQFDEFREVIFFEPSEQEKLEGVEQKKKLYLADIFSLWSEKPEINPWLLSPSVQQLAQITDQELKSEDIKDLLEKLDLKAFSLKKDWDTYLKPLYGREYKTIAKELTSLLSSKFEPRVFSVLCYGKVGRVTQKLVAIIARKFEPAGEVLEVKKIYWL